jgi:hypothetical protein
MLIDSSSSSNGILNAYLFDNLFKTMMLMLDEVLTNAERYSDTRVAKAVKSIKVSHMIEVDLIVGRL